eukprot:2008567-Pleurochrysis_carterae.AAC.3
MGSMLYIRLLMSHLFERDEALKAFGQRSDGEISVSSMTKIICSSNRGSNRSLPKGLGASDSEGVERDAVTDALNDKRGSEWLEPGPG